jgi:hypothetical protein
MNQFLSLGFSFLITMTLPSATAAPPRPGQAQFDSLHVAADGTLFAGVISQGTYRSADGGSSWVSTGVVPDYASLSGSGALGAERQLCVSRDAGGSWNCLGLHETVNAVLDNGTLYKCAADRIASSVDGGKTWTESAPWNAAGTQIDYCQTMAARGNVIYVQGEAVYRSTDRGAHWTRTSAVPAIDNERILGMMLDQNGTLYASSSRVGARVLSIYGSADGGRTWSRRTFGLPAEWEVFSLNRILAGGLVFSASKQAGQPRQLFLSTDSQSAIDLKFFNPDSGFVDVQEGKGKSLFIVTRAALYRSDDAGAHWRELGRQGIGSK